MYSHRLLDDQFAGKNFCDNSYYDKVNVYNAYAIPGDWMLIWYDDFNYGTFDWSFYRPDFGWGNIDIHQHHSSVAIPENINLINGKLILTASYSPGIYKNFGTNWDNSITCYPCPDAYFDYTVSAMKTNMVFPLNSRFHVNAKAYPNPFATWSALWLRGDYGTEIDMFEMVGTSTATAYLPAENSLKMTYHSTLYGYPDNSNPGGYPVLEEGVKNPGEA